MNAVNILLVDDEERFLSTARRLLTKRGLTVSVCARGRAALRFLDEHAVDVALIDLHLPDMDGLRLLEEIKRGHPEVQIILLSGDASDRIVIEGLRMGAFSYVLKPASIREILMKIEEACERKSTEQELKATSQLSGLSR
jgi:DNA-binding response OmpR family regulator